MHKFVTFVIVKCLLSVIITLKYNITLYYYNEDNHRTQFRHLNLEFRPKRYHFSLDNNIDNLLIVSAKWVESSSQK